MNQVFQQSLERTIFQIDENIIPEFNLKKRVNLEKYKSSQWERILGIFYFHSNQINIKSPFFFIMGKYSYQIQDTAENQRKEFQII